MNNGEKECKTRSIRQTSYTWKEAYGLPYESYWSRIAKFCFLNGLSWFGVQQNVVLKSLICESSLNYFYSYIPSFYLKEHVEYGKYYMFQIQYEVHKICPMCMKHGYHSVLHEIEGLDYCVFHQCSLIQIDSEKFYESRYGTYEFYDVKVENIVRNDSIVHKIEKFIHEQKVEKFIASNYIFLNSNAKRKSNKCYESTERLYQKLILLQNDVDLYGCKCIVSTQVQDIKRINSEIFKRILHQHIRSVKEKDFFYLFIDEKSHDEMMQFFITYYVQKGASGEYVLKNDLLGWCFFAVISEEIQECFEDLNDWYRTFEYVNNYSNANSYNSSINIKKISVILAYQAITGATSPEKIQQNCSKYWTKGCTLSSLCLPVYDELGDFERTRSFYKGSPTEAAQYIIYPIIRDLFYDLVSQTTSIFKQNLIKVDRDYTHTIKPEMWSIPQYVVFYFQDKVDIYRCEPEYDE